MSYEVYFERYKELCANFRIARTAVSNPDDYDVIIQCIGTGYAHKKYRVVKNGPVLSTKDLAIICDGGNLCFGYRTEGNVICVHTD